MLWLYSRLNFCNHVMSSARCNSNLVKKKQLNSNTRASLATNSTKVFTILLACYLPKSNLTSHKKQFKLCIPARQQLCWRCNSDLTRLANTSKAGYKRSLPETKLKVFQASELWSHLSFFRTSFS